MNVEEMRHAPKKKWKSCALCTFITYKPSLEDSTYNLTISRCFLDRDVGRLSGNKNFTESMET